VTRVVSTLSGGALAGLAAALASDGIRVEECPLLQFAPPTDWEPVDHALAELDQYQAVAFTSPRAAAAVASRWRPGQPHPRKHMPATWATGPATAAPLGSLFGAIRILSENETRGRGASDALARAILAAGTGSPVLYPCGEIHRFELTSRLTEAGYVVREVICYRSVPVPASLAGEVARRADVLVVGSPRVAELLLSVCPPGRRPRLLALGPTTAATSRRGGWPPDAEAERPTVAEVVTRLRTLR
jgi:uroporphyrinogen III methyltransferase/synthase